MAKNQTKRLLSDMCPSPESTTDEMQEETPTPAVKKAKPKPTVEKQDSTGGAYNWRQHVGRPR